MTQKLLEPHLKTMELKLRPGMVTLTWTSMNIDAYKAQIQSGLTRLEDLVTKINDIVENRIQKNLKQISRTILVSLPEGAPSIGRVRIDAGAECQGGNQSPCNEEC